MWEVNFLHFMVEKEKNVSQEGLLAAFAYFVGFITGLPVLLYDILRKKKNPFVRFHAMQSTILFGGIYIAMTVLFFIPILGWIIEYFLGFLSVILWVLLMWKAYNGEKYKLPIVGGIAERQLAKIS